MTSTIKTIAILLATIAVGLTSVSADKLHLADGRVLDGTVEREGDGYIYFKYVIGGIEHVKFFTADEFTKIDRTDHPVDAKADRDTDSDDSDSANNSTVGDATRVALLNFGPPGNWHGEVGTTVGIQISAAAFKAAIPMLKADNTDAVIVRINSGGGLLAELDPFYDVFEEYKREFRTVAWVESAISCAAMSPWALEEFYMMTHGNIGGCTGWSGQLQAMKGLSLEMVYALMEDMSDDAKRDRQIMRAMQHLYPLSCDIDEETNEVTWYQTLDGEHIVNPEQRILTFNAVDAVKFQFAEAIADTKEELVKVMGLQEVEWVGQKAAKHIDEVMIESDRTEKKLNITYQKYGDAVGFAQATQDRRKRGAVVGKARAWLREMKDMLQVNPNFSFMYAGLNPEWFEEQEALLRELAQ